MRRSLPFVIIVAVLLLGLGGGLMLFKWKRQQQPSETSPIIPIVETTPEPSVAPPELPNATLATETQETTVATETPVTATTPEPIHIRGGAKAAVTLEEYGDFQCAPCGRLYPVLKAAEHDYGDRLRVVFRHMPLQRHEHAPLAARAAEAAGLQGRFWEMHDLLFENSTRWTKGIDTVGPDAPHSRRQDSNILAMDLEVRDVFFRYAEILKLDVERFKRDLDSEAVRARVESDHERGAGLGIDRTPTLYINGHHYAFASTVTSEALHAAIDAALSGKMTEPSGSASPAPTSAGSK